MVPVMYCNFYLVKNHKIANDSATTEAREKMYTDLESVEFFDVCLIKLKTNQILLNKMSHIFSATTKLFIG